MEQEKRKSGKKALLIPASARQGRAFKKALEGIPDKGPYLQAATFSWSWSWCPELTFESGEAGLVVAGDIGLAASRSSTCLSSFSTEIHGVARYSATTRRR